MTLTAFYYFTPIRDLYLKCQKGMLFKDAVKSKDDISANEIRDILDAFYKYD